MAGAIHSLGLAPLFGGRRFDLDRLRAFSDECVVGAFPWDGVVDAFATEFIGPQFRHLYWDLHTFVTQGISGPFDPLTLVRLTGRAKTGRAGERSEYVPDTKSGSARKRAP
jgi:hypothetical protein